MSQPHHHVFNALQSEIYRSVPFEVLRPILLQEGVVPPSIDQSCDKENGMRIVVGYLRNKGYEKFLKLVECMCTAQDPIVEKRILDSMLSAVQDFDAKNSTQHSAQVKQIIGEYIVMCMCSPIRTHYELSTMQALDNVAVSVA